MGSVEVVEVAEPVGQLVAVVAADSRQTSQSDHATVQRFETLTLICNW